MPILERINSTPHFTLVGKRRVTTVADLGAATVPTPCIGMRIAPRTRRGRLAQQLLTGSLVLAVLGAVAGAPSAMMSMTLG